MAVSYDSPEILRTRVRPLPLHESGQVGVVLWPHKLLMRPDENLVELYDLEQDPTETRDLSAEQPGRLSDLQAAYNTFPRVHLDRTRKGRRAREKTAQRVQGP